MNNIADEFAKWMDNMGFGVLGSSLFIGGAPDVAQDDCWWIVTSGGNNIGKNVTGEKQKNYLISVYYRNTNQSEIYNRLEEMEFIVNRPECIQLGNYEVLEAETTLFPADQDLDIEERSVGLIQITLTIYQEKDSTY